MANIPRGPENLVCPLHRKAMAKVCHTCPLWVEIRGKHPQTGNDIGEWNCAFAWAPMLAINAARELSSVAQETNAMRNEAKKAHDDHLTMAAVAVQRATSTVDDCLARYAGQAPSITHNQVPALTAMEAAE